MLIFDSRCCYTAANIQTKNYTTKRFHLFYVKEWRALFFEAESCLSTEILCHQNEIGDVEDDFELDDVIGYVDSIVPSTSEDEIYGNVFIFKDGVELIGDFFNYCAYVDQDYNITKITAISIK